MSNEITVHYKMLTKHVLEDENEVRRYSCSECGQDIFNVNVHAQFEHDTLLFDIDPEEAPREHDAPFHPCGVSGCEFAPHEGGPHSWESKAKELTDEANV